MSDSPAAARYKQRWVAYLDILGYRNMVADALAERRVNATIDVLQSAIQYTANLVSSLRSGLPARDLQMRILSDSICITTAPTECGGERIINMVAAISASLALRNIFVRGAISRGGHYDDSTVLFSPAMIEAYQIEDTIAKYPRVLVPDNLAAEIRATRRPAQLPCRLLWSDEDGHAFVNYLFILFDGARSEDRREWLSTHKLHVEKGLERFCDDPKIGPKYDWLSRYHNRFCRETLCSMEREQLMIDTGTIRGGAE